MLFPLLNFVGIGVARCGRTGLCKSLQEFPGIFIAVRKELQRFQNDADFESTGVLSEDGLRFLEECYPSPQLGIQAGDFTPRYMIKEKASRHIRGNFPRVKKLALLRDRVDRVFYQYNYFRNNEGKEGTSSFERALIGKNAEDYIVKSRYSNQVEQVLMTFPSGQVLFTIFQERINDLSGSIGRIRTFLGLKSAHLPSFLHTVVNVSLREHMRVADDLVDRSKLLQETRASGSRTNHAFDSKNGIRLFERHLKEDVEQAGALLCRSLAHWNPSITLSHFYSL